jgi:hypothetical protein
MSKAAEYVLASMHRAMSNGQAIVEISVQDLNEVMREHLRLVARVQMQAEMPGSHVGWMDPDKRHEMMSEGHAYMVIRRKKNEQFHRRVFAASIPEEEPENKD